MTPAIVVGELTANFMRAHSQHARAGRTRTVEIFEELITWINNDGQQLAATQGTDPVETQGTDPVEPRSHERIR